MDSGPDRRGYVGVIRPFIHVYIFFIPLLEVADRVRGAVAVPHCLATACPVPPDQASRDDRAARAAARGPFVVVGPKRGARRVIVRAHPPPPPLSPPIFVDLGPHTGSPDVCERKLP